MATVKVVIQTGGNLKGESSTATTTNKLIIDGTGVIKIPVTVDGETYYMIAASGWSWAS